MPFRTGLLIGIGETRAERVDALLAIRDSHARHGHVQEAIVQNFRAKQGTRMAKRPDLPRNEHLWTIAAARLILPPEMTIQAPPNLQRVDELASLLRAEINDWGGVTRHPRSRQSRGSVAPSRYAERGDCRRRPGADATARDRAALRAEPGSLLDPALVSAVRPAVDARGLPVLDSWRPGTPQPMPMVLTDGHSADAARVEAIIARTRRGERLDEAAIVRLIAADGPELAAILAAADDLRRTVVGEVVTHVVNRNINYTNVWLYKCGFCAFAKGSTRAARGPAYRLDLAEVGRRAAEAWTRGATEVCLQGGIHPDYDGKTYLAILHAVRDAAPNIHIHAFSPLEVSHGARTLRIMFGHVESYHPLARHLLRIRDLQEETGGLTEFVPLPFVHDEVPMWRKGLARSGPSHARRCSCTPSRGWCCTR